MIYKSENDVKWLEFELLADFPKLKHAVFLRHGGVSQGPYGSLNLSHWMGDSASAVSQNLAKIKQALGIKQIAECRQVHEDGVASVDETNWDRLGPHDALITNRPDIALKVTHADCQAAIIYDPIQRVIGTVHCGWRGHVCQVYLKAIAELGLKYGSKPADLLVAIAPSLGPRHAEFVNYRQEFPSWFWQFQASPNHFDLWALARSQLQQAGILPHHIQIASICTYANPEEYFSFRRSHRVTGAHATLACLLP